jgi:hypothetical protein
MESFWGGPVLLAYVVVSSTQECSFEAADGFHLTAGPTRRIVRATRALCCSGARVGLSSRCVMNPKARIEHRRMPTPVLPIAGRRPLA